MTSDSVEEMKAAQAFRKILAQEQVKAKLEVLKTNHVHFIEQSKNVFRLDTPRGAVMYYPTSNTWQHRGKTIKGPTVRLVTWLKEQHLLT